MGVALAVIVAIAVGLPLVSLTVARRLPSPRLRPTRLDAEYDLVRRHRLGAPDHIRVQDAVREGRRVDPERLVPVAREYAELVLARSRPVRGRRLSVRTRRQLCWTAAALYLVVVALVLRHPLVLIYGGLGFVWSFYSRRELVQTRANAERALEANGDRAQQDSVIGDGASRGDLPPSLT